MKSAYLRWGIGILLILSIGGLCLSNFVRPSLKIQSTLELGEVAPRNARHVELDLYNSGILPLKISAITATCGCTKVNIDTTKLAYGEHGILSLDINSGPYIGTKKVDILIASNDRQNPVYKITVSMVVDSVLSLTPDHVLLGRLGQKQLPFENEIIVASGLKTKIPKDLVVSSNRDYLAVKVDRKDDVLVITYTLSLGTPSGIVSANIHLNSREQDFYFDIPFEGVIEGDFETNPDSLFLADIANNPDKLVRIDLNKDAKSYKVEIAPKELSDMLLVETRPKFFTLKAKSNNLHFKGFGIISIKNISDGRYICELPLYSGL